MSLRIFMWAWLWEEASSECTVGCHVAILWRHQLPPSPRTNFPDLSSSPIYSSTTSPIYLHRLPPFFSSIVIAIVDKLDPLRLYIHRVHKDSFFLQFVHSFYQFKFDSISVSVFWILKENSKEKLVGLILGKKWRAWRWLDCWRRRPWISRSGEPSPCRGSSIWRTPSWMSSSTMPPPNLSPPASVQAMSSPSPSPTQWRYVPCDSPARLHSCKQFLFLSLVVSSGKNTDIPSASCTKLLVDA